MESMLLDPRTAAVVYLLFVTILLPGLTWRLARYSRYAPLLWTAALYLSLLHAVAAASLITSSRFENGIAPLTLLTFPASLLLAGKYVMPGFATLDDLWANYERLILLIGGCNMVLVVLFARLIAGPSRAAGNRTAALPPAAR